MSAERNALEAVLLFHSSSPWDDAKRARWRELTGSEEATVRVLCDLARAALGYDFSNAARFASITCPKCKRVSHHPEDVRHRYCGACHAFHDDLLKK